MTSGVRVAYLVLLVALVVGGFFLDIDWRAKALIGAAVMLPIVVADIITTRRRTADSLGHRAG